MELRDLLDLSNVEINNIEQRFEEIAKHLFQGYCIKKGNDQYKLLEIEFYYYTKDFEDIITYPRNVSSGKWFFHDSGVDITFESKCTDTDCGCDKRKPNGDYFGGILIRSLLKNDKELITGPLKCSWALFDFIDAFVLEKEDLPLIVIMKMRNCQSLLQTVIFQLMRKKLKLGLVIILLLSLALKESLTVFTLNIRCGKI